MEGNIDTDEYYELIAFIEHQGNREEIISLIHNEFTSYEQGESAKEAPENTDKIFEEILEKANSYQAEQNMQSYPKNGIKRILLRISAAAVIIMFLAAGTISVLKIENSKRYLGSGRTKEKTVTVGIAPASNSAVLTLASGKQIILDSAGTGIIARQGASKISNAAGKLDLLNSDEKDTGVVYNVLSTHRANQYQIALSDGSKVWLNAASSITFPNVFAGEERRISVTGEVYFEVAKNPLHPFVVNVNGISIRVLGTHFNVNAYHTDKVSATLLEGSVQVSSGMHKILIKPGEAADVTEGNILVHKANLNKAVAWKNGEFYFEGDSLSAIMEELGRWYDINVLYEGKISNNNARYSGSISRSVQLSNALLMLQKVSNADFKIVDRTVTVIL